MSPTTVLFYSQAIIKAKQTKTYVADNWNQFFSFSLSNFESNSKQLPVVFLFSVWINHLKISAATSRFLGRMLSLKHFFFIAAMSSHYSITDSVDIDVKVHLSAWGTTNVGSFTVFQFVFNLNFDCLSKDLNLQTLMILVSKARPFICFQNKFWFFHGIFSKIVLAETLYLMESVSGCLLWVYTWIHLCQTLSIIVATIFSLSLFKRQ